jgi:hypothetical protein
MEGGEGWRGKGGEKSNREVDSTGSRVGVGGGGGIAQETLKRLKEVRGEERGRKESLPRREGGKVDYFCVWGNGVEVFGLGFRV